MLAEKRLPRMVFDYLDGGAEGERGLRRNLTAFNDLCFEPWRLLDVSQRDLSIELFVEIILAGGGSRQLVEIGELVQQLDEEQSHNQHGHLVVACSTMVEAMQTRRRIRHVI